VPRGGGRQRDTLLLGALAVTLAGLAAWQLALAEEEPLGVAMPVRPPAVQVGAGPGGAAAADTAAIIERPLFSEARRRVAPIAVAQAAPPPPVAAAAPPPLSSTHQLVGLVGLGDQVIALVRAGSGKEGAVSRLRLGDQLAGWTLDGTDRRRAVVFTRGEERQTLALPAAAAASDASAADPLDNDSDD
jgi:hypothetical protein